ncbi:MAG TPA: hypothetical protein VGK73_27335 [Polyangiaceae bacterium]
MRSNRSSRSRREPRPEKIASVSAGKASHSQKRRKTRNAKPDPRGLAIEQRASSIPPAQVHDVFDVGPDPSHTPAETPPLLARAETPPPPAVDRRSVHAHAPHFSKAPPAPPRPTARPPSANLSGDPLATPLAPIHGDSLPVLTAPPTDAPVAAPESTRSSPPWFAIAAAGALVLLAGVVLGARTRSERAAAPLAPGGPSPVASSANVAGEPPPAKRAALAAPVPELPSEPPGAPFASSAPAVALEEASPTAAVEPASTVLARPAEAGGAVPLPAATLATAPAASATEPAESEPELAPFDAASAATAISSALGRAASCRSPGEAGGSVTATLTYAPSGRVTTALVSGAFAGTSTGGCIAGHLRSARVAPFSGEYVTVKRTIVLP